MASSEDFHLLDDVPIGICVINNNYEIIFWNRCLETWTKIYRSDVTGKPLHSLYPHFNEAKYKSRIDTILSGGPPAIFSSQLHSHLFPSRLPGGKSRIVQTTASNIPAKDNKGFYALFAIKDLTELSNRIVEYRKIQEKAEQEINYRKSVATELKAAMDQILLQQKAVIEEERLKLLLQMAGATVHELDQPLLTLLENIRLLDIDGKDPEKTSKHLDEIGISGKKIEAIINKMRKVADITQESYYDDDGIINTRAKEKILHVEDNDAFFGLISILLKKSGFKKIIQSNSLKSAKSIMQEQHFDLIILDYQLPDGDAFDLLMFLKEMQLQIPVIIITGKGNEVIASKMIRFGVSDYIAKSNVTKKVLVESINFALQKHNLNRDRERAIALMSELSTKDELTGLYNRRYFIEALSREISGSKRYEKNIALCIIDIDHFKQVNDTYGHTAGDQVLKGIAKIIETAVRQQDIPCRYGGEEFSIILPNTDQKGADKVCSRIRQNVEDHVFTYCRHSIHITLSGGIAFGDKLDTKNPEISEILIKKADSALYQAKRDGRNKIVFHET